MKINLTIFQPNQLNFNKKAFAICSFFSFLFHHTVIHIRAQTFWLPRCGFLTTPSSNLQIDFHTFVVMQEVLMLKQMASTT